MSFNNDGLICQQNARQAWRESRFDDAAQLYTRAAELSTGMAARINRACASDCRNHKAFNGTPSPDSGVGGQLNPREHGWQGILDNDCKSCSGEGCSCEKLDGRVF